MRVARYVSTDQGRDAIRERLSAVATVRDDLVRAH
jgi:hypothetical protein